MSGGGNRGEGARENVHAPAPRVANKAAVRQRAPGKRGGAIGNQTLLQFMRKGGSVAAFPGSPLDNQDEQGRLVQKKCAPCDEKPRVQTACEECKKDADLDGARPALDGAAAPLPHSGRIQEAFGRHDLSEVRTLTGAAAAKANDELGARAFTSGHQIAFRDAPDEWLAAHESAHVIQQREGKSAPDGGDDAWERHADRVADEVVAGRSAQPLLDQVAGGDGSAPRLQLDEDKDKKEENKGEDKKDEDKKDDGSKEPDDPPGKTVWALEFQGVRFTTSPKQTREALEAWAVQQDDPHAALDQLIRDFAEQQEVNLHPGTDTATAAELGMCRSTGAKPSKDEPDNNKKIALVAGEVAERIIEDDNAWLQRFHGAAVECTNGILDDSHQHVVDEMDHYGLRDFRVEDAGFFTTRVNANMDDDKTTRSMAIAAEGLVQRKKTYDENYKALLDYKRGTFDTRGAPGIDWGQALQEGYDKSKRDYEVYKMQVLGMFPLLASFSMDEGFDFNSLQKLTALKKGRDPEASAVLADEIGKKLVNIDKVRKGLPTGETNVWTIDKIVAAARASMGVKAGSLHDKILSLKVKHEKPNWLTGIFLGILQFALVLLAPATEGLSLIGAAAISAKTAYDHFKEYETQEQLHNTDFGPAALSAEDPSLFWLAVDIVGAGFDVAAAGGATLKIFRQIAGAAKAIKVGETGEAAQKALANLERAAADAGGETLARQVRADAEAIQNAGKKVGMTAEEAHAMEEAGEAAEKTALETGAVEAPSTPGGSAKVSAAGDLWSCHSPCEMMRERYRELLKRKPEYGARIDDLEGRARALTADDPARKALADEAAALEREMRTTALPGEWSSPLQFEDAAKYEEQVARRGSAAADLDYHPPGWTGKDEAVFRYGKKAINELPEGYQWVLQENGELILRRTDTNLVPRRFNAGTNAFEEVGADIKRAEAIPESKEIREFGKLDPARQKQMNDLMAQRTKLIEEREGIEDFIGPRTEADTEKSAARLSKVKGEINEQSRQLGEAAADELYKGKGKLEYPFNVNKPSTTGDFDRVFKVGDEFHVVEAKGGTSGLGTKTVNGKIFQQGTPEYLDAIIGEMKKNPSTRALATELEAARSAVPPKVKYVLVRAPVDTLDGADALKRVYSVEFKL